jgi:uncharacterized protein with GYD domain
VIFISLGRLRKKLTRESVAEASRVVERASEEGVKFLNLYYTLGRYDVVAIFEATDEKTAMRMMMLLGDIEST